MSFISPPLSVPRWLVWSVGGLVLSIPLIMALLTFGSSWWIDAVWFAHLGYYQVWLLNKLAPAAVWLATFLGLCLILSINSRMVLPVVKPVWRSLAVLMLSGVLASLAALDWFALLKAFYQVSAAATDPIFNQNVSFYLFRLPVLFTLQRLATVLLVGLLIGVAVLYRLRQQQMPITKHVGLNAVAQRHLLLLAGALFGMLAWGHWLSRYSLLYSNRGSFAGANYTDVHAQLPANLWLTGVATLTAIAFVVLAIQKTSLIHLDAVTADGLNWRWNWRQLSVILVLLSGYGLSLLVVGLMFPLLMQKIIVLPNELERDRPYIEHNIQYTRQGFNLTEVEVEPFEVTNSLTAQSLEDNAATLKNIRLWDNDPLLTAYRQLQEIRPYYQFPSVDVDRYTIGNELRQVMHSARELDYTLIPDRAQTWVNRHFFYTHGYGITLSPVNVVTRVGLPDFFIQDIPPRATTQAAADAFPINNPAIYYGELTDTPVFVKTKALELDYPKEEDNIYATYQGTGGLPIGQFWQRLLYAIHFRDLQMLLSQEFTPESRFIFRRQILERVQTIAPFLRYDRDPYMVIADDGLYWMIDAYTVSDRYPYSEPAEPEPFNYIRNSVKVVVDAYNGSVDFYVADPKDVIIATYQRIYPSLMKPLDAMPAALRSHIRYPLDLFQIQTRQYATYHMSDAQVFYNKEDVWQIPQQAREIDEPTENEQLTRWILDPITIHRGDQPQQMPPHYLILELASIDSSVQTAQTESDRSAEFVLLSPFTPLNKQNLIAWMAAHCDGDEYGKLLVYQFSRASLIFGPQQVEARISQNPVISEQISLWNQQGSRVNRGSLLIIPVEQSLIYVQPLYLEAEDSKLPELTRVIVVYNDQVVMQPTLDEALAALFTDVSESENTADLLPSSETPSAEVE